MKCLTVGGANIYFVLTLVAISLWGAANFLKR